MTPHSGASSQIRFSKSRGSPSGPHDWGSRPSQQTYALNAGRSPSNGVVDENKSPKAVDSSMGLWAAYSGFSDRRIGAFEEDGDGGSR